jgi:hypothetical protein
MLGKLPVLSTQETPTRLALLIWGDSSVGKTTFAATAPGKKKLWLNLDPEGKVSIIHRDDILVTDLDGLSTDELFKQFQNDNPFGLDQFLADNPDIETVCLDSATALSWQALQKTVGKGVGGSKSFTPTIEAPGISAYGGRNNVVLACLTGLLKVTAKHNRHCIITTHEDDPKVNPQTSEVLSYNMVLGGKLVSGFTWRLSEIWYMSIGAIDNKRRLAFWPTRLRKPMKSRMFRIGEEREILLNYNPDLPDSEQEHTIAGWYNQWIEGGGQKLDVPTRVVGTKNKNVPIRSIK